MFDVERFIAAVEARPALYDVCHAAYKNREVKRALWADIGAEMYADWPRYSPRDRLEMGKNLVTKWKSLRDNFMRDFKLASTDTPTHDSYPRKKRYTYFKQMKFLIPTLIKYDGDGASAPASETANDDSKDDDDMKASLLLNTTHRDITIVPRSAQEQKATPEQSAKSEICRKRPIEEDTRDPVGLSKKVAEEFDKNGHRAFLLSFLPIMDQFSPFTAMEARFKITEVFRNLTWNSQYATTPPVSVKVETPSETGSAYLQEATDSKETIICYPDIAE